MAKYGKTLAQVVVEINGKQQVQRILKAMEESAEKLKTKIAAAKKELDKLAEGGSSPEYTAKQKEIVGMERELTQLKRAMNETHKLNLDINDVLANMSNYSATVLNNTKKRIESTLRAMKPVTEEQRQQMYSMQQDVKRLADEINNRLGKVDSFERIMAGITHVDDNSLKGVIKHLKELISTTDKLDGDKIEKYTQQLAFAEEILRQRTLKSGENMMVQVEKGAFKGTIEETQQAIKLLEEYKKSLKTADTTGLERVTNVIKQMNADLEKSTREQAAKVMDSPTMFSPKEIEDAIKVTEKLQADTKDQDAWHALAVQIKEAKEVRDAFADNSKHEIMKKQFTDIETVSANAFAEQKKYWESMRDSGKYYDEAIGNLKEIARIENERLRDSAGKVMGGDYDKTVEGTRQAIELLKKYQGTLEATNTTDIDKVTAAIEKMNSQLELSARKQAAKVMASPTAFSPEEIDEAIKMTEKLQAATSSKDVWNRYALQIEKAKEARDAFADESKHKAMTKQFEEIADVSANAFSEQKKYWESMRDSGKYYDEAIGNLKEIARIENDRLKESAGKVMGGDYDKTVEGTRLAIELLKKYQGTLDTADPEPINKITEAIKQMNAELDNATKNAATKTLTENIDKSGTKDIKEAVEWLTKYQGTLEPLGKEWRDINKQIEAGNNRLKELSDSVKMEAMADQFSRLVFLSDNALKEQKKYWEEVFRSAEKGTNEYIMAEAKLNQIKGLEESRVRNDAKTVINEALTSGFNKTNEETREAIRLIEEYKKQLSTGNVDAIKEADKAIVELNRKIDQAKLSSQREVVGNLGMYSSDQIKNAVDWLTKYRATLSTTHPEWAKLGIEIQKATEYLENAKGADAMALMNSQMSRLGDISSAALAEQKKYWQDVVSHTEKSNTQLAVYEDNLRKVLEEEKARKAVAADAVMNDLSQSSVEQIREAIKATEELRNSVKRSSPDWNTYNTQIENAKNYLESFETASKKTAALDVANNLNIASTGEMKKSIDFLTKYRDTLSTVDPEYQSITKAIDDTTEALKKFQSESKMDAMNRQMVNLNNLSKSALAEQKKYWQEVRDGALNTSQAYQDAERNLLRIQLLEEGQTASGANRYISEALSGNFDKTIKETEEAVKLIEEYKKQLRTGTDAAAINEANQAIEVLNRNLGKAKEELMDVTEARKIAESVKLGIFDGTSEDIEKAKKSLEEFRKTLNLIGDKTKIKEIEEELSNLSRSSELGGKNLKRLDKVLGDLSSASVEDLKTAAKQLEQQLQGATRGVREYAETAANLRRVNRELERARQEWEAQESLFVKMTKRLTVYMAAYGSLETVFGYIKDVGKANLELSDTMSDVEKTTGLSADQVARLGKEIDEIDTRTAQQQLYELAAAAGQIGLKSESEILGFVKAANMITVSLNELGTEGTTALMKIATLTGEASAGTEKALLSIGSAINELTAASAATAGPIVDLMNRMGGIAAQSGITSAEMAAIGATADALGQSVEITGTSMNKFLATLMSGSDQIAYALNMDAKALRDMINTGKTMDAVIAIFERMNDMGGLGNLAPVMGELGSEGARMTQVLAAMAERVDFLKGQVELSTEAYDEAVSIQNEYNVKNENAIAILQRMGNAMKETFVNSGLVQIITDILRATYNFFSWMKEASIGANALTSAITAMTTALLLNRVAWIRNLQAMVVAHPVMMAKVFKSLTISIFQNTAALGKWLLSLVTTGKGINLVKTAVLGLWNIIKANPILAAASALAFFVSWIVKTATYVSEAAKATAKFNRELQEETNNVDTLFNSLKRLSTTEERRAQIINQINQQYGEYLGFMLDEKDSAEKLAAAHQLINTELRKRMALNLQTTLQGNATNEYAENLEKTIAGISKKVENIKVRDTDEKGNSEDRELYTSDVLNTVSKIINDRVYDAVEETSKVINGEVIYKQIFKGVDLNSLKSEIKETLQDEFKDVQIFHNGSVVEGDENYAGRFVYAGIESYIEDMLSQRVAYQKKIINAEEQANIALQSFTKDALNARKKSLDVIRDNIKSAQGESAKLEADLKAAEDKAKGFKKSDNSQAAKDAREEHIQAEKALRDHYNKMVDNANDYVQSTQKLMKDHNSTLSKEDRERMNQEISHYTKLAKEVSKKVPGIDPWGKGRDVTDWKEFAEIVTNLDTSSATALAAAYKKIKEDTANIPDNLEQFYAMFQTSEGEPIGLEKLGFKDAKSVADLIFNWEKQIREKLKTKFHRNTSLGFIFDEDGDRDQKAKARQEYQAALSALEAYYKEYEDYYRQQKEELGLTDETLNQQILNNDEKFNRDRQQLIRKFLGEESTFDKTKYIGVLSNYDYFGKKDLDRMAKQYQQFGDAMTDGGRNQIAKSGVKIQEAINKEKLKISALLEDKQYVQKAVKEMQDAFEQLNVTDKDGNIIDNYLWGDTSMDNRTQKESENRMSILQTFSEDVYAEEADAFKKRLLQDSTFGETVKNMDEEQYAAFILLLQQYHDKVIIAEKQHADERMRIIKQTWEEGGFQNTYDTADRTIGIAEDNLSTMQNAGAIANEQDYFDQYQELVLNRVALEQWAYEQWKEIYRSKNATQEQFQQLELEHTQKQNQFQQQLLDNYISRYQKMADVTTSYGNIIGEGFGNMLAGEEDAGKQLIKNLLTETIQMASQFAQRLILQNTFGAQMQQIRNTQNTQQLAAAYTAAMNEIGIEASKMMAIEAIAAGKITAQSMTQPDSIMTFGASGAARAALIIGLVAAATSAALALVNSLFPSSSSETSTANRKLSTGMLTYAEGNYPVLGNDGNVYNAKYEGAGMKTGIYGGGAHFGIFSEKQPEMIVDGKTTQKLILNYPYIYDAITTIAKNGRLVNAMPTFAAGDYPAGMRQLAQVEAVDVSAGTEQMTAMQEELAMSREVNRQLLKILQGGITAHVDGLENYKQQKKNERFLKRRGID